MRRGMYRPASRSSHAAIRDSGSEAGGSWFDAASNSNSTSSCNRFNLDLPTLGCGHPCSIRVTAHEVACGWSVRNENHARRDFSLDALERDLTVHGSHTHTSALDDTGLFHVVGVHVERADDGLILGRILPDVDLLALFGRTAGVHDKAPAFHGVSIITRGFAST